MSPQRDNTTIKQAQEQYTEGKVKPFDDSSLFIFNELLVDNNVDY